MRTTVLVLSAVLVCCIPIKADILPLILVGDPVPGVPGSLFTGFGGVSINASGTIAFNAGFTNGTTNGSGIFEIQNGQVLPIVMEGQAAPDNPASTFTGIQSVSRINGAGNFAFVTGLSGQPNLRAIYATSGTTLYRVVDTNTPAPGMPGYYFEAFDPAPPSALVVNDQGEILFPAFVWDQHNSFVPGAFAWSQGVLSMAAPCTEGLALNNPGNIACNNYVQSAIGGASILVYSGGSANTIITPPYSIPNSTQVAQVAKVPSINDAGDVAFLTDSIGVGRFSPSLIPNAILRWHNGSLDKIAAAGDPVPGFNGAVFQTGFGPPIINNSAILFAAAATRQPNTPAVDLIERFQNGQLNVVASSNDYLDGIGMLDPIAASFDNQDGEIVAFVANAGLVPEGIFEATAAQQFTLRFPQIADGGGGAAGGWRTSIILANRSATAANATISFFNDDGTPLSLAVGGIQQSQTSIVVPALGVAEVQTQGGGPLTAGWAQVQSDQNLTGSAIFGLLDGSGNSVTEVGAPASFALNSMSVFAQNGATTSTGIALANPNNAGATVTLTLKDSNSTQLAQTSVNIAGMGHISRYANELFPSIPPGEFQGKIEVLSTLPVVGLTLRQRGSVFTSLPIIP
jgi:hypothetical protein